MTNDMTIKKWVDIDTTTNWTPDLPALRYNGGGIPIFLWDDNQDYGILKSVLNQVSISQHVEFRAFAAKTADRFLPWYNLMPDQNYYPSYCLEEAEDVDFLSLAEYTIGKPMQMEGKIIYVSLEALQELDYYYENEFNFNRVKIKVHPNLQAKTHYDCFTWLNDVDSLCEFDNITNEYVFRKGIDPVPYRETNNHTYAY